MGNRCHLTPQARMKNLRLSILVNKTRDFSILQVSNFLQVLVRSAHFQVTFDSSVGMKYVLVQWSSGNLKTSILTEEYILDKSMLSDPNKEGMVVFVKPGEKHPIKHKVKAYLGRVKYVSDQRQIIEEQQRLLLKEVRKRYEKVSSPASRKRQHSVSEDAVLDNAVNENCTAKKCTRTTTTNHCGDSSIDHEEEYNEMEESREIDTIQKLHQRIAALEEELADEKALVKELQRANLVLQNNLPDLLRAALESCPATQQLKPSSSCTCVENVARSRPAETVSDLSTADRQVDKKASPSEPDNDENIDSKPPISSHEMASSSEGQTDSDQTEEEAKAFISSQHVSLSDLINSKEMTQISNLASYRRTTQRCLSALFEKSVLANSSVTGKSKAGRPALDRGTVELIIAYVKERFPQVAEKDIKATMAQKCKDTRKSIEKKDVHIKMDD